MSIIQGNAHTSAGGGYQIERSLRFNSADSANLTRTPASNGNRRRWTISAWMKLSTIDSGTARLLGVQSGSNFDGVYFSAGECVMEINTSTSGSNTIASTAVFRDPSAWYHIVGVYDSDNATASNRMILYVNNQRLSLRLTNYVASGTDSLTNSSSFSHTLGQKGNASQYFNGYMTEVNFIDGQALTPSSFGETDSATGVWKPKAYSGTYGTNGFYLPFKTASNWSGYFDGTGDKLTSSTNAIAATGEFSVEAWVYQTARTVTSDQHIFSQYTSGATSGRWYLRFNGTTVAFTTGLGTSVSCATTVNTGTWYHVCVTRDSSNRVRVFLNGVLDGTAVISGSLDTAASVIGATQTANYWQGYISNVRAVSGQIPTAYQTSSTTVGASIFTPSTSQLTAVSGTSLLTCQSSTFVDNSGLGRTITASGDAIPQQFSPFTLDVTDDHSGTGNNWQPNNLDLRTTGVGGDILVDSPTSYGTDTGVGGEVRGNYCTWNPLMKASQVTLTNGNLDASHGTFGTNTGVFGGIAVSSGKWYWEETITALSSGAPFIGIMKPEAITQTFTTLYANTTSGYAYRSTGDKRTNSSDSAYGASYTTNDVIGVALDMDAGTLVFYKNGVSQGTAFSSLSGTFVAADANGTSGGTYSSTINFGQRAFAYTAPSGFKALCTQNLPTPTIGATSTTQAGKYFSPVLYTGTGSTRSITSLEFQPDFTWIKPRSAIDHHILYDAVRGVRKQLYTNLTNAEETETQGLSAFLSNGFTVGGAHTVRGQTNDNGVTYVAWNWKANGAGSSNTAGNITSTVSVSTDSGFSIVTYTGNGSANQTVGHGLGVAPAFGILKDRDTNSNNNQWHVFHTAAGDKYGYLSATNAFATTAEFYPTSGSSTTVTVGRSSPVANSNESGDRYVMYLFAPVAGYSAFGSYTGNGSADGPFVFTNFRPRFVMIKRTDSADNWYVKDTARDSYNPTLNILIPNSSSAEIGNQQNTDFLSNGFKIRTTDGAINASGGTYIYMALAENPFKYSLAR